MNHRVILSVYLLGCLSGVSLGETAGGSGSAPPAGVGPTPGRAIIFPGAGGSSSANINPNTIKSFDENFFSPMEGQGSSGKPEVGPGGRTYGPDADYNTEQREQWLAKCAPYKNQDSKLFRECFMREREKMKLELREKFDAVERRQGRGSYTIENLLQPSKSSGGFD